MQGRRNDKNKQLFDEDEVELYQAMRRFMRKVGKRRLVRVLLRWIEGEL